MKRAQLRQQARADKKAQVKYGPRNWKSWYRPGDQSEPPNDVPGRPGRRSSAAPGTAARPRPSSPRFAAGPRSRTPRPAGWSRPLFFGK